jgi:type VII secretion-associated serine protease mycosin
MSIWRRSSTNRGFVLITTVIVMASVLVGFFFQNIHQRLHKLPFQSNVNTMSQTQLLAEDLKRSQMLATDQMRTIWLKAVQDNQTNQVLWKQWLSKHPNFLYIRLPGNQHIYHAKQSLVRQLLTRVKQRNAVTHLDLINQHYIVLQTNQWLGIAHYKQLTKMTATQQKNVRYGDAGTPKGPNIRSIPNDRQSSHFHRNQIVVKFKVMPASDELQNMLTNLNARVLKRWQLVYLLESRTLPAEQLLQRIKQADNLQIEYAESHYVYTTNEAQLTSYFHPNDLLYAPYQSNLMQIHAERAWKLGKGNRKATIAVIDTGVDLNHPDLKAQLIPGYNAIDETKKPQDEVGHGTHVTGVIGAKTNNLEGIAGISWYNPIMPIKVLDASGSGYSFAVAQGIVWATDHGAKVINLSLGNYAEGRFLRDAVKYAYDRDVLLIAASGNENTSQLSYPAAYPEVLAVGAVDDRNRRTTFSNYGRYLDVVAPDTHIVSTFPDESYAALSGTSMATPHVTALAGLIRSAFPHLKNTQVMHVIKASAIDLGEKGRDDAYGHGLIDIEHALRYAADYGSGKHSSEPSVTSNPLRIWLMKMFQFWRE